MSSSSGSHLINMLPRIPSVLALLKVSYPNDCAAYRQKIVISCRNYTTLLKRLKQNEGEWEGRETEREPEKKMTRKETVKGNFNYSKVSKMLRVCYRGNNEYSVSYPQRHQSCPCPHLKEVERASNVSHNFKPSHTLYVKDYEMFVSLS